MRMTFVTVAAIVLLSIHHSVENERACFLSDTIAHISSCYDGDTCTVITKEDFSVRVRLAGIDAPERKGPEGSQPLALESRKFLEALTIKKSIRLRHFGTDRFHRPLVELRTEKGQSVNRLLVLNGYAQVYRGKGVPPSLDTASLEAAEVTAKTHKRGIWQLSAFEDPGHYRRRKPRRTVHYP